MKTLHIHIEGQVQGVGFRPFVYRLAKELNLNGWVNNGVDGVHIEAEGHPQNIVNFISRLKEEAPPVSCITSITYREISHQHFSRFEIIESKADGIPNLLITPDIGLCDNCKSEINDWKDHRHQYPFTTCTHCGPRYSILKSLPYDRATTTMNSFTMCPQCEKEYYNPADRRYYSQTNSCPNCAIQAWMLNSDGDRIASSWEESFPILVNALAQAKIIAMKGIGGYLLLADACNEDAIRTLRERKHRPTKPFALMYPDLETLRLDAEVSEQEAWEFTSIQSPIVLVKLKAKPASNLCRVLLAPALDTIGAMQPYTAMFELLMKAWKKPLIATSANLSDSPIFYKDDEAIKSLGSIADYFLIHNREIETAQDDSVLKITPKHSQRIVVRRSRGFAPTMVRKAFMTQTILALGADMKSAFALQANGRIYTSQYLGDLESYESQESFRATLDHLIKLVRAKPDRIVIDAHPNYYSSHLGKQLASEWRVPVTRVQHHKAHAYAVLAENDLLNSHEPLLCVVWDGTGYGDDGNSWGGEFFERNKGDLNRIGHLGYAPVWLGDRMAKYPKLAALFIARESTHLQNLIRDKFSSTQWNYYSKVIQTEPEVYTSSMGRLIDAVACLLSVCEYNSFEGQSAMYLEELGRTGNTTARYPVTWKNTGLDVADVLEHIVNDIEQSIPSEQIAFKFHAWQADVVYSIVKTKGYKKVLFSGGVFQNALLTDLIIDRLKKNELYFHRDLSPNDENISFGQLACVTDAKTERTERAKQELKDNPIEYVLSHTG